MTEAAVKFFPHLLTTQEENTIVNAMPDTDICLSSAQEIIEWANSVLYMYCCLRLVLDGKARVAKEKNNITITTERYEAVKDMINT